MKHKESEECNCCDVQDVANEGCIANSAYKPAQAAIEKNVNF